MKKKKKERKKRKEKLFFKIEIKWFSINLYVLILVAAETKTDRQTDRRAEIETEFDCVILYYMLLWSRHQADIRNTIWKTRFGLV